MSLLNQYIVGTGLPDALHSRVTVLPFLAVTWPLCGRARRVGGTETKESTCNTLNLVKLKFFRNTIFVNESFLRKPKEVQAVGGIYFLIVSSDTEVVVGVVFGMLIIFA